MPPTFRLGLPALNNFATSFPLSYSLQFCSSQTLSSLHSVCIQSQLLLSVCGLSRPLVWCEENQPQFLIPEVIVWEVEVFAKELTCSKSPHPSSIIIYSISPTQCLKKIKWKAGTFNLLILFLPFGGLIHYLMHARQALHYWAMMHPSPRFQLQSFIYASGALG